MTLRPPAALMHRPSRRWRRAALAVVGAVVVVAAAPAKTEVLDVYGVRCARATAPAGIGPDHR